MTRPPSLRAALVTGLSAATAVLAVGVVLELASGVSVALGESPKALVLPRAVRRSMTQLFVENNRHWDEVANMNQLEQMLGTVGPTQREYLGCLQGRIDRDTVRVTGWTEPADLKQGQFWVDGSCTGVKNLLGTWHTHPYRADVEGKPVKERALSDIDLRTFGDGEDLVTVAVWDADSLDAAIRRSDGSILHPAPVVVK